MVATMVRKRKMQMFTSFLKHQHHHHNYRHLYHEKKYNLPINYQTTKNMLKAFEHCDTFLVTFFLLKFQPLWSYFWYHHHRHDGPFMMKMAGIWRTSKEKELILFGQRSGNKCIPLSTLHYDDDVHDDGDDVDVGAHHHDVDDNLSSLLSKTHIVVLMSWSEL